MGDGCLNPYRYVKLTVKSGGQRKGEGTVWASLWRVGSSLGFFLAATCLVSTSGRGEPIPPAFELEQRRSDPDRPARAHVEPYGGPIIDTHLHLLTPKPGNPHNAGPKEVLEAIKSSGVEMAIIMPTPNKGRRNNHEEGVRLRKKLVELGGKRIKRFCSGNYLTYWMHQAYYNGYLKKELQQVLDRLLEDLASGECAGVGEVAIYHFMKRPRQKVLIYPPSFEPFLKVVELVAERGIWLDLHAEPVDPHGKSYEAQVFGGIELLFRRNPTLKLILSHTAMTNSINVRRMLLAYPKLMLNMKLVRKHHRWRNLEPIVNPEGQIYEDWAELFEEMPRRFMIGTDGKFGRPRWKVTKYRKRIHRLRAILGTLDPKAAKLIAYGNAHRNFETPK